MMFTGTSQQQDTRFSDKEKKLMKQMRFGDCLNKRVDMSKVKLDVLRPWISKKITDFLHIEDDVVVEFVYNQLEEEKFPCPKKMQINMTGFLNGRNARQFMDELWALLLSAQDSETGIPVEFINQKKDEIMMRKEENSLLDASKISDDSTILKDMLKASIKNSGEYLNLVPKEKSRSRSRESNFGKETVQDVRREKIRSPRQKSREGSQIKNYSRDRVSRKRNSRDRSGDREANDNNRGRDRDNRARGRDRERNRQRSLSRIVDRKRRRSYSKEKKGNDRNLNTNSSRKKSRSASKQRERGGSKSKSKSSALITRSSPKTRNVTTEKVIDDIDGNKNAGIEKSQKLSKVQAKLLTLATSGLKKRDSRSRSRSNSTLFKKQLKRSTTSKSLEKSKKKSRSVSSSSSNSSTSSSDSSKDNEVNKKNRSYSSSSFSKSPDNKREGLEINKKHDSVQKKRHYRRNKKSSSSVSPDKLAHRRHQQKKNFGAAKRQSYPRGCSPIGKGGRQRSRSPRQRSRSRNRSRSLMRSPKRFQRRSPFPSMKRGRGSRIRSNIRRQSPMRERGRLNQSPRVRRSPWDRRSPGRSFNRDRRSPPFRNKQSPFYDRRSSGAHERILSPYREKRLSPIRDRKMTTIRNRRSPFSNRDRRISPSREKRVSDFRERKSQVRNRQNSTERFQPSRRLSVDRTNSSSDRENRVSPTTNKPESFRSGRTDEDDSNQNRKITENLDEPSDICLLKKKSASNKESNSIFGGSIVEKTEIGMQSQHSQMKLIIKKSNLLSNISDKNENKIGLSTNISSEQSKEFKDSTNNSKDVEKIFNNFSLSLSRTPSPFLKSYEKEKQKNDKSMLSKISIKKFDISRNLKSKIRRISSTSDGSSDSHTEKEEKQYKSDSSSNEYIDEKNMANKINDEKILDTNLGKNPHLTECKQGKQVKIKSVEKNDQILHSEIKFSDGKVFEKMEKPNPEIKSNNNSSDIDQKSNKKLKRNKKTHSKESDVESSSDSDTEMKKKKHKKHKKHGKRSKKHKKHKKKIKRNNSSDSDEEDYDFSKVPRLVINDDLEKQLRERALKSMKKQTSISD